MGAGSMRFSIKWAAMLGGFAIFSPITMGN
jgi:hypothetical protein